MATVNELQAQLDALKNSNRAKEKEMQKAIRKQKAQDDRQLTTDVGKLARACFPNCKTLEDFERMFKRINSRQTTVE